MRCISLLTMAILLAGIAHGQSPVSADLSSQRVSVNEIFQIIISANGSDVKEPNIQAVADAGFILGNPSHQSSTSIRTVQGATTVVQSRTWRYPVSMTREGTFTIPRIAVTVDGREYLTPPMQIEVTRSLDMGARPPNDATELTMDDLVFVRAATDKTVAYQGETVALRLRLYVLDQYYVSVESPRSLALPDTEGFYAGRQWQQTLTEQYEGRNYRVTEIGQVLYPAMPGETTIGAWQWQGAVRWFDSRRRPQTAARMFNTDPIRITVLPLPSRPPGFSGAVGRFSMHAHLAQETLTQGSPVRFIVTVSGEGNPNTISAPTMPDIPWAHVSGPEAETRQQDDNTHITKLFSYLLTPLEAGEHAIPPVEFTFFAPMLKNYRTERSAELTVEVEPSADGDTFVAIGGSAEEQRRRIDVFDGDMLPIVTDATAIAARPRRGGRQLGFPALISPALTVLLLPVLSIALTRRRRLTQDTGYARRYYAKKRFQEALVSEGEDAMETLYRATTGFTGDMLDINEAGLTSSEAEKMLRERDMPEEPVAVIIRVLKACERARYAGRASTEKEMEALLTAAEEAVARLYEYALENQQ